MQVIIDRFEGDYAVVEIDTNKFVNLPRILLDNANEGDIVNITIDKNQTLKEQTKIEKLMKDVFSD